MRREIFRGDPARALALLRRAPVVHLATTTPEGAPVLRALDAAVTEDGVFFHGARAGEKVRCVGRPAVVSAEEVVAHLPSTFSGEPWACPASTLYQSVQVHGPLEAVEDPVDKARALEALMRRWQPEGGYAPIDPADPHYAKELGAVLVLRVPLREIDGKEKLLQNRSPEAIQRVMSGLWGRGDPGDVQAIEVIRGANPAVADPEFLAPGDALRGVRLHAALGEEDVPGAVALLAETYGWEGVLPREAIGPAQRTSTAWVGARGPDGALVATARATADAGTAWIHDVVVAAPWRGKGLGQRLMRLLLGHPAVRRARFARLSTRDAQGFYARFGFVDAATARSAGIADLVRVQDDR